tara:strand:+ start:257 stop:535 length:279 start_codon:yes stop_codon:yes gene_type:complete
VYGLEKRIMKTKQDYMALVEELEAIENKYSFYIVDRNIDRENIDATWKCGGTKYPDDPDYWDSMYTSACDAAGMRMEDIGKNINELIGRTIY